jgi:hypothetical protein
VAEVEKQSDKDDEEAVNEAEEVSVAARME